MAATAKLKSRTTRKPPAPTARRAVRAPAAKLATASRKLEKLPSLAELKRQLDAISDTAIARAEANSMRLIGRPRL